MNKKTKTSKKSQIRSRAEFSRRHLLYFVLIFAIVGAYILWRSLAAPPPPSVYLTPVGQTFGPNSTFSIQVRENSGTTPVNAVQANFSYPASLLTFVSISSAGSAFPTVAQSTGSNGQVYIGAGVDTSGTTTTPVTGDQLVATVTFSTGTASGPAALAFTAGTEMYDAVTDQDILGGLSATAGGTDTVDASPPAVSVTTPADGAKVAAGGTITVTASASDSLSSVAKVEVYIDGSLASTLTASPYTYAWNTAALALGSAHTIQAKAYDAFNNTASSAINTVTLADLTPPTASITSPGVGASVRGTINVNAAAVDNTGGTGISKVELYVDGSLYAADTSAPYTFSWNTSAASNASHILTVKAYDGASPANSVTSPAVSVTVDNSPPTIPASFRSTSTTYTSISLAWNAATDNAGVTGYQLSRNGTVITTTSGSTFSYTDSGLSAGTSYSYSLAALDAAGNSSAPAALSLSTVAQKPGDINGDGKVDLADLAILLTHYGQAGTRAQGDLSGDGRVSLQDLAILLTHYGS